MACAVAAGPAGGGTAAVMVAAADLVERGRLTAATFNGIVLLLLVGGVGGYLVRLALAAEASVADAARSVAAAGERERLAREIHDSTLQVLALIARRGREIGGDGTDLADLAARQEAALRSLVATAADASGAQHTDLRSGLLHLASDRITVTGPAAAVEVPDAVARAVLGAVREALANVERHAGAQAKAWVFVEAADRTLTVTVRDDGSGMPAGRLAAAAQDGRLGVAQSIVGRVAAAGGTVRIDSRPGEGTEVEITVPR
jgi:signal transduction histidine kinase